MSSVRGSGSEDGTPTRAPYGTWASPVSAEALASSAIGVSDLRCVDGKLYWLENRPRERGRMVAMTEDGGLAQQLTPQGLNVRTRVHEYGGGAYAVAGDRLYFANFEDQRLYAQAFGDDPFPITPDGYRYADFVSAPGGGLIAVREHHGGEGGVRNAIVHLSGAAGDAGRVLFEDSDFVAYPRLSADGRQLAWIAWNHPNMPWDDSALYVARLGADGLSQIQVVTGPGESVMEPQWAADGALYFISDRSGFWNLYVRRGDRIDAVLPMAAEFARPLWSLGQSNYALMDDGRVVAVHRDAEGDHLGVIDSAGAHRLIPSPFNVIGALTRLDQGSVALIAASGVETSAVVTVDTDSGATRVVRRPSPAELTVRDISRARAITVRGYNDRDVHALYYPPTNAGFVAPPGEQPPLIVQVHGGPTGQASPAFSLANQFWTSRGFGIVDVDYGGSSGYGRAYRKRLEGQWGVVDVEDVISAVRHLIELGLADPQRIAIHGGSAGGFTVLAALSQSDVFKAGASFYGVADLTALARDTHKFESRYLDGLVGPYPEAAAVYDRRSPLNHLDGFQAPLIIFQGADDPIVPPNQAHLIVEALRGRQQPVAYLEFAGEGHGFRRAETLIASKNAELYFYAQVFGFKPADDLAPVSIDNWPRATGEPAAPA